MIKPVDVVVGPYRGIQGTKDRPAVVVSADRYHTTRPDIIVAVLTKQIAQATGPTDYVLQDWAAAGLHVPSAFRSFLNTHVAHAWRVVGHLSDRDWQEVQARLRLALAVT